MLTVIQLPTSSRSCFQLILIQQPLLQFTSSCHQEPIQLSLSKSLPKIKVLTSNMYTRSLLDKVKMLLPLTNLILATKKATGSCFRTFISCQPSFWTLRRNLMNSQLKVLLQDSDFSCLLTQLRQFQLVFLKRVSSLPTSHHKVSNKT